MTDAAPETALLLQFLDQAFDRKSWHGTTLKGSLRGLTVEEAAWRPQPGRRCVAQHAAHCAYWKYTVRRRLLGEKRGSFALAGSNWFELPEPFAEREWRGWVDLLGAEHRSLRS